MTDDRKRKLATPKVKTTEAVPVAAPVVRRLATPKPKPVAQPRTVYANEIVRIGCPNCGGMIRNDGLELHELSCVEWQRINAGNEVTDEDLYLAALMRGR